MDWHWNYETDYTENGWYAIDDNYHFVLHYISGCFKNGWFNFEKSLFLEISFDKVVKRSLIYKKNDSEQNVSVTKNCNLWIISTQIYTFLDMNVSGSSYRKPTTGTRFLNNRKSVQDKNDVSMI